MSKLLSLFAFRLVDSLRAATFTAAGNIIHCRKDKSFTANCKTGLLMLIYSDSFGILKSLIFHIIIGANETFALDPKFTQKTFFFVDNLVRIFYMVS